MSETWTDLVIREETLAEVDAVLGRLLQNSLATCALLINRNDGSLITAQGVLEGLDTVSLAALAAGSFASAAKSRASWENPSSACSSTRASTSTSTSASGGRHALLMTLFDGRTTIGLVRLCAREAGERVGELLGL